MAWKKTDVEKSFDELFRPVQEFKKIDGLQLGVFGPTNSGKTHFCCTAPDPIFIIDTENNAKKVASKFTDKEIYIAECLQTDPDGQLDLIYSLKQLEEAVDKVVTRVREIREAGGQCTIALDSGSDIWTWISTWLEEEGAEKFTKKGTMMRTEWGKANKRYLAILQKLRVTGANIIVTGRAQEIFDNEGKPLGIFRGRWQKDTEYWLDLVLQMTWNGVHRIARLHKCRFGDLQMEMTDITWQQVVEELRGKTGLEVI